jgi:hypothetical protein
MTRRPCGNSPNTDLYIVQRPEHADHPMHTVVINACLSVCGPTFLVIPACRANRRTIRPAPWRSSRRASPSAARKIGPSMRSPIAKSIVRAVRGASGMVAALAGDH